jgi:hypothetical protein
MFRSRLFVSSALLTVVVCVPACEEEPGDSVETCLLAAGSSPDFAQELGCEADYAELSSAPPDASIPGATSAKTVVDLMDGNALYFMNSQRYCVHWEFASEHLSGNGLPIVPELGSFNQTEYYSPDRRFLLGALSHYSGPDLWVYEISPYDNADADMITTAFRLVRDNSWLGDRLAFHPTSVAVEAVAASLPSDIPVVSTSALFEGVAYQPLNVGTTVGLLAFHTAKEVDGNYTNAREVVVLDDVPNDISIVAGIITANYQTPLSHINVLSVNRGTPNMGLIGASDNAELRALEGKWVELTVGSFEWSVKEVTAADADAWWASHKPEPLTVQPMDLTVTDLRSVLDILDLENDELGDAISAAIPVFGAKATNYGALAEAQAAGVPVPVQAGFAIPMFYYDQFMRDNGLWELIEAQMALPEWESPAYRESALEDFQDTLRAQPMRAEVRDAVVELADSMFPGENIRFRSSTNAEDLGTFTGAGLYNSETGDPSLAGSDDDTVEWAMKKVWSQVWNPRAYEEREYYSMNQTDVGMALLVHANFPEEEANGVAITNNPFDPSGLEPALYVNAQEGSTDVVSPDVGVLPDAYLQYFSSPGQPIVYIQHSTEVAEGDTVLTNDESYQLGVALDAIHSYFYSVYGESNAWYAMDVEWKFDDKYTPGTPALFVKQARPFAGWSNDLTGACSGAE